MAAGQHPGRVRQPRDEAGDALELGGVVQRSERDIRIIGQARGGLRGLLGQCLDESVIDPGSREDPGGGRAVLAGVEVAGDRDAFRGGLHVGVIEYDAGRLAAELEMGPLEVGRRGGGHLHAGAHRTGDRYQLRGGM